jgi:hypothetical protein
MDEIGRGTGMDIDMISETDDKIKRQLVGLACEEMGGKVQLAAFWHDGTGELMLDVDMSTADQHVLSVLGLGALAGERGVLWNDAHAATFARLCQAARVTMTHPVAVLGCVPPGGSTLLGLARGVAAAVAGLPPADPLLPEGADREETIAARAKIAAVLEMAK